MPPLRNSMAAKSEKGGEEAKKGEYTLNFTELQPTAVKIAEHAVTSVLSGEVRTNHRHHHHHRHRRHHHHHRRYRHHTTSAAAAAAAGGSCR